VISRSRRNAALVLGVLGTIGVLFFASGGLAPCMGVPVGPLGLKVLAQCVADYWGFATEGALVPLLAAVWAAATLVWLRPPVTLKLAAMAVPGAVAGLAAWLVTRSWTQSWSETSTGSIATAWLRPTAEVAVCWLPGGALAAVAVTAVVAHLREGHPRTCLGDRSRYARRPP
jgi:hypothetical protein